MSDLELEELIDAVACGAASEAEERQLEERLAAEPGLAAKLDAAVEAVSLLAYNLEPEPPPEAALGAIRAALALDDRRWAEAGAEADAVPRLESRPPGELTAPASHRERRPLPPGERAGRGRRRRSLSPVAMVALAAAAAFALLFVRERGRAGVAENAAREALSAEQEGRAHRESLAFELAAARQTIADFGRRLDPLRSPKLQLATLRGDAGATAKILMDPEERRWLVLAYELPPAGPDHDYQLWFVPPEGAPVSAGLLESGPEGLLGATPDVPAALGEVRAAISLEPKGGSPQPTLEEIKLIGELL